MFCEKYTVEKEDGKEKFGSITIENIEFTPAELQKALPDIILKDDNLKYIFVENNMSSYNKKNIYKRFIPANIPKNIDISYVKKSVHLNHNFYSFLAEGLLGLIFRDVYNYNLCKGLLSISDTPNDTHSGVDACMYNKDSKVIVLGEAKLYDNLKQGIDQIIDDFINKNIFNKLDSLYRTVLSNPKVSNIFIRDLEESKRVDYVDYTIAEFLNQDIIFAGFVLHSAKSVRGYEKSDFYDKYNITIEQLKKNIIKTKLIKKINSNIKIIIVHLPVNNKNELIKIMIEEAIKKLGEMNGESHEK